ncbi:MAG: glycine cleavage system aminomethyltransferase GcvT [Acidimicrobiia bacterium]
MPQSPINDVHVASGARFTDFGGWSMPVQYAGVLEEHGAVRSGTGVFDVSHLGRFEVTGPGAIDVVRSQLCNDIAKISPGRAQYTMALNEAGGIEDDIIVWYLDDDRFWVMPNGTNSDEIVARFIEAAPDTVVISDIRSDTALLAVQGPGALELVDGVMGTSPGRFRVASADFAGTPIVMAGTGYTGERGAELRVPSSAAPDLWNALVAAGATPCGLGARDTLRLEMGYPLWGQDLDATTSPIEAGLQWVVGWDHEFVGKQALVEQRDNPEKALVAFTTEGRAIPRHGYSVSTATGGGLVTSGNFSPTLGHGIGLAYISPPPQGERSLLVSIRGNDVEATIVDLPFVVR